MKIFSLLMSQIPRSETRGHLLGGSGGVFIFVIYLDGTRRVQYLWTLLEHCARTVQYTMEINPVPNGKPKVRLYRDISFPQRRRLSLDIFSSASRASFSSSCRILSYARDVSGRSSFIRLISTHRPQLALLVGFDALEVTARPRVREGEDSRYA